MSGLNKRSTKPSTLNKKNSHLPHEIPKGWWVCLRKENPSIKATTSIYRSLCSAIWGLACVIRASVQFSCLRALYKNSNVALLVVYRSCCCIRQAWEMQSHFCMSNFGDRSLKATLRTHARHCLSGMPWCEKAGLTIQLLMSVYDNVAKKPPNNV